MELWTPTSKWWRSNLVHHRKQTKTHRRWKLTYTSSGSNIERIWKIHAKIYMPSLKLTQPLEIDRWLWKIFDDLLGFCRTAAMNQKTTTNTKGTRRSKQRITRPAKAAKIDSNRYMAAMAGGHYFLFTTMQRQTRSLFCKLLFDIFSSTTSCGLLSVQKRDRKRRISVIENLDTSAVSPMQEHRVDDKK